MSDARLCRNCGRVHANRPRGLCWSCYYTPGLRDQYPSTSKFARRGIGNFNCGTEQLPSPTRALPGTSEKVDVLARRATLHQSLWHPLDGPSAPVLAEAHAG